MSLAMYALGGGGESGEKLAKETSLFYNLSGLGAAEKAEEASELAAGYQREALDYLKEVERVPQQYRTAGTAALGAMYGLGTPEQQAAAAQAFQDSPVARQYDDIGKARLEAQEQGIARSAAATGGLRSGATQRALAEVNAQAAEQRELAKMNAQLRGLGQLSQLQTMPESIYTGTANIGNTLASGIMAGGQARQAGATNFTNAFGQFFGGMMASDERLKSNVKFEGFKNGHRWHSWEWNDEAEKLGLKGRAEGVIAQYVKNYNPEAVSVMDNGYYAVDYNKLGVH